MRLAALLLRRTGDALQAALGEPLEGGDSGLRRLRGGLEYTAAHREHTVGLGEYLTALSYTAVHHAAADQLLAGSLQGVDTGEHRGVQQDAQLTRQAAATDGVVDDDQSGGLLFHLLGDSGGIVLRYGSVGGLAIE